jgi:hypothetical protein
MQKHRTILVSMSWLTDNVLDQWNQVGSCGRIYKLIRWAEERLGHLNGGQPEIPSSGKNVFFLCCLLLTK